MRSTFIFSVLSIVSAAFPGTAEDAAVDATGPVLGGGTPDDGEGCKKYIDAGMSAMHSGDVPAAVAAFRKGTLEHPHEGNLWKNLAVALAITLAEDEDGGANEQTSNNQVNDERFDTNCEARSAAGLALRAGADGVEELLRAMSTLPAATPDDTPRKCPHDEALTALGPLEALRKKAAGARSRGAVNAQEYLEAAKAACTPDTLLVDLTDEERESGNLSAGTLHAIGAIFDACGLVAVKDMFSTDAVDTAANAQAEHFYGSTMMTQEMQRGVEVKQRGEALRIEVVCPLTEPLVALSSSTMAIRIAYQLLQNDDVELDTFSYIVSEPGSTGQSWHCDVSALFDEHSNEGSIPLPPYGMVTIIPLIDLVEENGPTEFLVGSNLPPTAIEGADEFFWHYPKTGEANPNAASISLELPKGSALFFDIRTTHRGGANRSFSARPILYLSYFRDWFTDRVNFSGRQSQWWHSLSGQKGSNRLKKLYSRLDERRYTKMLEDMLVEKGVDLSAL